MTLAPLCLALLTAAPAATAPSPKYHRDEHGAAFLVELHVPGFVPGYDRVVAVPRDDRTFLLYTSYDDGHERDRPTPESLQVEITRLERSLATQKTGLAEFDRALAAARAKNLKVFKAQGLWGERVYRVNTAPSERAEMVEVQQRDQGELADLRTALAKAQRERAEGALVYIAGRFTTGGPATVEVQRGPARGPWVPQVVTTLKLELPTAPVKNPEALTAWAMLQSGNLARAALRSPGGNGLALYVGQVAEAAWGAQDARRLFGRDSTRGDREPDLYGVMTGLTAVQEALQLDAMAGPSRERSGPMVKLTQLKGPHVASHDYEALRKGVEPKLFDAASAVPADTFALHFTSAEAVFTVIDLLDAWGTDLAHALEGFARDRDTRGRFFTQLALPRDDFTRLYASRAVEAVTVIGHDPFVREGTDLTVVLTVSDAGAVRRAASAARDLARAQHPDAVEKTERYQGVDLVTLQTPDRVVSTTFAESGRFAFLGNSPAGVKAALDAASGRAPSLARQPDFRYVRTLFAPGEDAFVFLSDAFVRSVVGPRWKIGARRRLECASHLQLIEYGRILAQRDRAPATTLAELQARGFVPPALKCAHGGTYTLGAHGAECSVHGRLSFLTPLVELPFTDATAGEAEEYQAFTDSYRQYWRKYIDPVGVRVKLGPPLDIETIILPLVDNTIYSQLRDFYTGAPASLQRQGETGKTIAAVTTTLSPSPEVQRALADFMREAHVQGPDPWRWLGDQVSFVVYDGDPFLTVDGSVSLGMMGRRDSEFAAVASVVLSSLTLPTALVVKVKDPVAARAAVERLAESLELEAARHSRRGRTDTAVTGYRLSDASGQDPVGVVAINLTGVSLRLYYAVVGDQLFIATRRWLAEEVVGRGTVVPRDAAQGEPGHLRVRLEHGHLKAALAAVQAGWGENMRDACFRNLTDLELVSQASHSPDLVGSVRSALAYAPYCPAGGSYRLDALGEATCSVHGKASAPKQPRELADATSTAQWLGKLEEVDFSLTFTPEGLRTHVVLVPKK